MCVCVCVCVCVFICAYVCFSVFVNKTFYKLFSEIIFFLTRKEDIEPKTNLKKKLLLFFS